MNGSEAIKGKVLELTGENFDWKTRAGVVVVLVYAGGVSGAEEKMLEEASLLPYDDEVSFMKLDAAKHPEVLEELGLPRLPVVLFKRNGVTKRTLEKPESLEQLIEETRGNACYRCIITKSRTENRRRKSRR